MTEPFRDHAELAEILDALCEETISPEQMRRLEELVLSHPEAEAFYVQYMALHADLVSSVGAPPRTVEKPTPAPQPGTILPWALAGLAGLTALAASLLLYFVGWQKPPDAPTGPDGQPGERIDSTVAVLVRAPEAVWGDTELPTRAGSPLPSGWLRLKSGFAHLEFYSGATVILEGPAELRLISRMEAYCAGGKLRAIVPPHARGFTIGSPRLDLIDRGTEFGMQVDGHGKTEVHVFTGLVEVYEPGEARHAKPRHELPFGRGLAVDGPGKERAIAPRAEAFRTAEFLALRARAEAQRRHKAWLAGSALRRKDTSLLAYYPFETHGGRSRQLRDEARGRERPRDGAIVGCAWVAGRWPGKRALEFKDVTDRVRVNVPGEFRSLTLAAWVRVDGLPNRNNALLMADGWEPGEVHWQIGEDGKLVLGVQSQPKGRGAHYHALDAITPDRFGRWMHLAVVYDADEGHVSHYVDGKRASRQPTEFDIKLRIGDAEIGNWNLAAHRNSTPVRFFSGRIDEMQVYSRALGEDSLLELYAQGRPPD
jgi:hypothetical protein